VSRPNRRLVAMLVGVAALGSAAVPAAAVPNGDGGPRAEVSHAELELVERPGKRFERTIEAHKDLVAKREARRAARAERRAARDERGGAIAASDVDELGVARSTLDAIAACESGGDPAAVNAAGYYGKYQFDLGTWQSVGGSGNPAEAPEVEQDYRAALLYERAGPSPWPVCG
jgi:soluble lytic murein transglycosylase-like protein